MGFSTVAVACLLFASASGQDSCLEFQNTIKQTYNFRPALLASDAEREKKSAAMDKVWETTKANKERLIPCLRQVLEDPNADPWFRFDGSNLLVSLDPSESSKGLQVRNLANTNLDDVDLRVWVSTLAVRGFEGFDTSAAAERWLSYPKARYFLPQHGAFEVNVITGALFLFGSMDESFATPALIRIVNRPNHPSRELALAILLSQITAESLQALKQVDISNLSSKSRSVVEKELNHPDLFEPRSKPKTTRQEFIEAFEGILKGNPRLFLDLVAKVPDGEKDVVATLTQDDLPLVRKVRRRLIAGGSPHVIEYYESFTKIIRTITLKGSNAKSASIR